MTTQNEEDTMPEELKQKPLDLEGKMMQPGNAYTFTFFNGPARTGFYQDTAVAIYLGVQGSSAVFMDATVFETDKDPSNYFAGQYVGEGDRVKQVERDHLAIPIDDFHSVRGE